MIKINAQNIAQQPGTPKETANTVENRKNAGVKEKNVPNTPFKALLNLLAFSSQDIQQKMTGSHKNSEEPASTVDSLKNPDNLHLQGQLNINLLLDKLGIDSNIKNNLLINSDVINKTLEQVNENIMDNKYNVKKFLEKSSLINLQQMPNSYLRQQLLQNINLKTASCDKIISNSPQYVDQLINILKTFGSEQVKLEKKQDTVKFANQPRQTADRLIKVLKMLDGEQLKQDPDLSRQDIKQLIKESRGKVIQDANSMPAGKGRTSSKDKTVVYEQIPVKINHTYTNKKSTKRSQPSLSSYKNLHIQQAGDNTNPRQSASNAGGKADTLTRGQLANNAGSKAGILTPGQVTNNTGSKNEINQQQGNNLNYSAKQGKLNNFKMSVQGQQETNQQQTTINLGKAFTGTVNNQANGSTMPQPSHTASKLAPVIQQAAANSSGPTMLRIKIKPEHLGEVTIRLSYNQGSLQAHFITAHAHTRELLDQSMVHLKDNLSQLNINLSDASTSSGNDGQRGAHQGQYYQQDYNSPGKKNEESFFLDEQENEESMLEQENQTENDGLNHLV